MPRPPERVLKAARCVAAGLVLTLPIVSHAAPQAGDWPLWPSQIEQSTQALAEGSDASESLRVAELRRLESAPDAIAEPYILRALLDESTEMRRVAMRACVQRQLEGCLPAAERLWMESSDPAIRLRSLQLLALFPNEARLETLLAALDGDEPSMRDQAAESLASAPLTDEQEKRLRTVLQAKLDDQSATVRRRAALTLGLRGPGAGTVNLIRHLDDPDPTVRVAVAQALGRLGDKRALPALRRALGNTPDRALAGEIVGTLGLLPGEEVDELLLELFDRPPFGRRARVIRAIGTRAKPGDALVDGLIARLRNTELHDSALQTLRWMGELARPRVRAALDRGLEASLAAELESFLAALDLDAAQTGTAKQQRSPGDFETALARAQHRVSTTESPGAWITSELMRASLPAHAHEALFTLALWPRPALASHDLAPVQARLRAWAGDEQLDLGARCLATSALARSALAGRREAVLADLRSAAETPRAEARACAHLALASLGDLHFAEAGLADGDPRVRAAAAIGLRSTDPRSWSPTLHQRLRAAAAHDDSTGVRSSARFALATPTPRRRESGEAGLAAPGLWRYRVVASAGKRADREHRAWGHFEAQEGRWVAPVFGYGSERWLIAPGIGDLEAHATPNSRPRGEEKAGPFRF